MVNTHANRNPLLPPEKRDVFRRRLDADLKFRGGDEIEHTLERCLHGLLHGAA